MDKIILKSKLDSSVNIVIPKLTGYLEARFVQRDSSYAIVYLSSQNGCNQSCRMCHLTQTSQVSFEHSSLNDFVTQATEALKYVDFTNPLLKSISYSFMARGEPLLNPVILNNSQKLFNILSDLIPSHITVKFKISTILPKAFVGDLSKILKDVRSTLYYSVYSLDSIVRKKWLPKALDVNLAYLLIKDYQIKINKKIVLHNAFIKSVNDSEESFNSILEYFKDIDYKYNLVRYNPPNIKSKETSLNILNKFSSDTAEIITRVGSDVYASCGMFYE